MPSVVRTELVTVETMRFADSVLAGNGGIAGVLACLPADSTTPMTGVHQKVVTGQRVAPDAVCHPCRLCGRSHPAQNVLSVGNGFQVVGVDASAISTKVVERQPIGNRSSQQFIHHSMRTHHRMRTTSRRQLSIAFPVKRGRPQPAPFCFLDLRPQPRFNGHKRTGRQWVAPALPPLVVEAAPSPSKQQSSYNHRWNIQVCS